ncbi:hypothetical protein BJ912DRAFT_1082899 [Pholiota molesta]|nr:hypothetical protein BJ912DRAFT_1082899 [Pholiota molesta]
MAMGMERGVEEGMIVCKSSDYRFNCKKDKAVHGAVGAIGATTAATAAWMGLMGFLRAWNVFTLTRPKLPNLNGFPPPQPLSSLFGPSFGIGVDHRRKKDTMRGGKLRHVEGEVTAHLINDPRQGERVLKDSGFGMGVCTSSRTAVAGKRKGTLVLLRLVVIWVPTSARQSSPSLPPPPTRVFYPSTKNAEGLAEIIVTKSRVFMTSAAKSTNSQQADYIWDAYLPTDT